MESSVMYWGFLLLKNLYLHAYQSLKGQGSDSIIFSGLNRNARYGLPPSILALREGQENHGETRLLHGTEANPRQFSVLYLYPDQISTYQLLSRRRSRKLCAALGVQIQLRLLRVRRQRHKGILSKLRLDIHDNFLIGRRACRCARTQKIDIQLRCFFVENYLARCPRRRDGKAYLRSGISSQRRLLSSDPKAQGPCRRA